MFLLLTLAKPICLLFYWMNVNFGLMLKRPVKEKGGPPPPFLRGRWKPKSPRKALRFIKRSYPISSLHGILRMRFNLNKIFASDAWNESWSKLKWFKWVQKSLNEPELI